MKWRALSVLFLLAVSATSVFADFSPAPEELSGGRLSAVALGPTTVRLTWAPVNGATGYRVQRNDESVAELPAATCAVVNSHAPARTLVRYRVTVNYGNGQTSQLAPAALVTGPENELAALTPGRYEVVVYGATVSGIAAAVALGQRGRRVLLVEPSDSLGGMIAGGLGRTDFGSLDALGGPFQRFMNDVSAYYSAHYPADSPNQELKRGGLYFEPQVARSILTTWLSEVPSVKIVRCCHLVGVTKVGRLVQNATFVDRRRQIVATVSAPVFIDASYEGDLAAAAGAKYRIGREPKDEFGEEHAGKLWWNAWKHQIVEVVGTGDRHVQAYNFRLCLTKDPTNRIEPQMPPNYDRARYATLLRDIEKGRIKHLTDVLSILPLPNGKFDANNDAQGDPSSDLIGGADLWPEATWEQRVKLAAEHRNHVLGLMFFMRNDSAVPRSIREDSAQWGLAADEFPEQNGWPSAIYVREGRRIVGDSLLTEHDISGTEGGERPPFKPGAVAVGAYPSDSHACGGRNPENLDLIEGFYYLSRKETRPYGIPLSVMTPKDLDNVIVSCAVSATHVAYGSVRMEPVFMSLGLAAGAASDRELRTKTSFHHANVTALQLDLLNHNQIITVFTNLPRTTPGWEGFQLWGTRGAFPQYEAGASQPMDDATWKTWIATAPWDVFRQGGAQSAASWQDGVKALARRLHVAEPTIAGTTRADAMAALWQVTSAWLKGGK